MAHQLNFQQIADFVKTGSADSGLDFPGSGDRYKQFGTTADVDFKTTKPCFATVMSHINQVVADTQQWEQSAAFRLEMAARRGLVKSYAKNDRLGLTIPYDYLDIEHTYTPDYLVRLATDVMLLLRSRAKKITAIRRNMTLQGAGYRR